MDPWISHISNSVGADPGVVRLAIGHVFGYLLKRYPDGEADEVIDMIPGARDVIAEAAASKPPKRKLASRALGSLGEMVGGRKGETFQLTSKLLSLGLTNDQLKRLTHEIFGGAALIAGREKVQRLTDSIPGLSGFLWPDAKSGSEERGKSAGRRSRKSAR